MSAVEARRLERIAELCSRDDRLRDAVVDGELSSGRAETLARAVTDERAPWLEPVIDTFLRFSGSDDDFAAVVGYWRERVDEQLAPRRVQRQSVTFSNRLFGGGDSHCTLLPGTYEHGCTRLPKHCDVHHLHERAGGGPTTVANGCLLCRFHHRLLHQHHWKLHQDTDGVWVATDPHGTQWKGRPTRPAAACASA